MSEEELLESIELDFAQLKFYRSFVVSTIKEDVVFSQKNTADIIRICSTLYGTTKFVYISHRVNTYNVDPTIYLNLEKAVNIAGIAIVSKKNSSLTMGFFEKNFAKFPFEVFNDFELAVHWARRILREGEE